jgi:hypothetical protein
MNMRFSIMVTGLVLLGVLSLGCEKGSVDPNAPFPIFTEREGLAFGFGLGAELHPGGCEWVAVEEGALRMAYPAGQDWGAVFITVGGDPVPFPRPCQDLSTYGELVVELEGEVGGEVLSIGIKDNTDPDVENKARTTWTLGSSLTTCVLNLRDEKFESVDLSRIYVAVEFIFENPQPRTVLVRNVYYLP